MDGAISATPPLVKGQLARAAVVEAPEGPHLADSLSGKSPMQVGHGADVGRLAQYSKPACRCIYHVGQGLQCSKGNLLRRYQLNSCVLTIWQVGRIFNGLSAAASASKQEPLMSVGEGVKKGSEQCTCKVLYLGCGAVPFSPRLPRRTASVDNLLTDDEVSSFHSERPHCRKP